MVENLSKKIFFLLIFFFKIVVVHSEPLPLIINYSPADYGALTQNWGVTEDKDGRIYFANNNGVLIYDGSNWKLISLPNFKSARSISVDNKGSVLVGSRGEFGFIKIDNDNEISYKSFSKKLSNYKSNDAIYETHVLDEHLIFFRSYKKLFLVENQKVSILENSFKDRVERSFLTNQKLFVFIKNTGLYKFNKKNKKFDLVKESKFFDTKSKTVNGFHIIDDKKIYITRRSGIYISNNNELKKIDYKNKIINETTIYRSYQLKNSNIALATYDGIFILNRYLEIIDHLNSDKGMRSNNVRSLYEDSSGNLWAGLDDGISKILVKSQFRFYPKLYSKTGGTVNDLNIFDNKVFISSATGLRKLSTNNVNFSAQFNSVANENIKSQTWAIEPINNSLVIGHLGGLGKIDKNEIYSQIVSKKVTGTVYSLKKSEFLKGKFFVGSRKGLFIFDNSFEKFQKVENINHSVWRIVEFPTRNEVWIFNEGKGIFRIKFDENNKKSVKEFSSNDGLPFSNKLYISKYKEKLIVGTKLGSYEFDFKNDKFIKSSFFSEKALGKNKHLIRLVSINDKYLFHTVHYENFKRVQKFYEIRNEVINEFSVPEVSKNVSVKYHYLNKDKLFFTSNEGVAVFDINKKEIDRKSKSKVIFSKILVNKKPLFFGGNQQSYDKEVYKIKNIFKYNENSFDFYFSATDYLDEQNNSFNTNIVNYKESNIIFSRDKKFTYENLPPGKYFLEVNSKNARNEDLPSLNYEFTINKPWWQTAYFYIGEIIFFMILLFFTIISKQNNKSQKYATALTFIMILILFEYINYFLDPLFYNLTDGVPVFNILSKVLLGVLLKPIENLADKLLLISSQYIKK